MLRIGVFVCWCGENIAATVDVKQVVTEVARLPYVVYATEYKYMCSSPGQDLIKQAVKEHNLTAIVVAACSPTMHEPTFRQAAAESGLNPYMVEMANIREQCSWVHSDREQATAKAIDLIRLSVGKLIRNYPLQPLYLPLTKRALVIGGGVAGIQAAIDIAEAGYEVVLVERSPSIGGKMSQLSETFPTLDCSQCILTPKMVDVARRKNVTIYTYAELEELKGFVGNFTASIRLKARSVDLQKCIACGYCWQKCPVKKIPSEFDMGLSSRTAIYIPFPQAVPAKPVIDRENCLWFTKQKCRVCEKVCPTQAIDYSQTDRMVEEKVGAIIVATGYDLYDFTRRENGNEKLSTKKLKGYGEYGYGKYKDVISGLQFERLLSASGPTEGKVLRPSDGKPARSVVFVACVGSRDPQKGLPYCSKICCMYSIKHMILFKHKVHNGSAYYFYMDIRAGGKDYEEFARRAVEEEGGLFIRGRISRIYPRDGQLVVQATDTLAGTQVEVMADLVVLATAIVPQPTAIQLAQKLNIAYNPYGFYQEAHPKLRPVETAKAGIFLAGACNGPKDIPESVAMASGAAAKVLALFSKEQLESSPITARVDKAVCTGCFFCERVCPVGAIEREPVTDKAGNVLKYVSNVNKAVCIGCGSCASVCPSNVIDLEGFTDEQLYSELRALNLTEE